MNLIWHIAKKDLRHFRWLILGWMAFQVLSILTVLHYGRQIVDWEGPMSYQWLVLLCQVIHWVFAWVMVILLMREDPLIESSSFWVTRPISGLMLLAGKLLSVLLCLWLPPLIVGVPWWLYCGLGLAEMSDVIRQFLLLSMLITLFGLCFGIYATRNTKTSSHAFSVWILAFLLMLSPFVHASMSDLFGSLPFGLLESRTILSSRVMVLFIALMVLNQFWTRRSWRTTAIGVGGASTVILILYFSPWNFVASLDLSTAKAADFRVEFQHYSQSAPNGGAFGDIRGKLVLSANQQLGFGNLLNGTWSENGRVQRVSGYLQSALVSPAELDAAFGKLAENVLKGNPTAKVDLPVQLKLKGFERRVDATAGTATAAEKGPGVAQLRGTLLAVMDEAKFGGIVPFEKQVTFLPDRNTVGQEVRGSSGKAGVLVRAQIDEWVPSRQRFSSWVFKSKSTGEICATPTNAKSICQVHGVTLWRTTQSVDLGEHPRDVIPGISDMLEAWKRDHELVRITFNRTIVSALEVDFPLKQETKTR